MAVRQVKDAAGQYTVEFKVGDRVLTSPKPVPLDWDAIRERVRALRFDRDLPLIGTRDVALIANADLPPDFNSQLRVLGQFVFDTLFEGELRREFMKCIASPGNLRIHWDGDPDDPRSAAMPWESFYVPRAPVSFLALTRKYSLTRRISAEHPSPVNPIAGAAKILFVSASPSGVPPLPFVDQEAEILRQIATGAAGLVKVEILTNATVDGLRQKLLGFRPDVFHFSGHGVFQDKTQTGRLIFEHVDRSARLVDAEEIALVLYENEVSLAILNGCDTGVSSTNDAVSSVAGALVKAGVPAVVATTRAVFDEAAMLFTREFYRSFLAGLTVEGSLGEARKALKLDHWDWSAYALFVGTVDLDSLRVMEGLRKAPSAK